MFKGINILLVLTMILLFSLCSCSTEAGGDEQLNGRPDVETAYAKAEEAYSWFDLTTLNYDSADVKEYNGMHYAKVTHETIKCVDDLRNYLQTLFTDEITETLLQEDQDTPLYRDFDGELYVIPAGRGADITKGEAQGEVFDETENIIQYNVTVDIVDPSADFAVTGSETYTFLYEYIEDDEGSKWVFTNFESIR